MDSPVKPLGDRIVVRKAEQSKVRASGIVLPDSMREQSDRGVVLAIGPGEYTSEGKLIPVEGVEVGETVAFSPYAGSLLIVNDEEFLVLRRGDVLGVLTAVAADG